MKTEVCLFTGAKKYDSGLDDNHPKENRTDHKLQIETSRGTNSANKKLPEVSDETFVL